MRHFLIVLFLCALGASSNTFAHLVHVKHVATFDVSEHNVTHTIPKGDQCQGVYSLRRAIEVPPYKGSYINWSLAKQTPDYGKTISYYLRSDKRSWQFLIRNRHNKKTERDTTPVGFGLFCIEVHKT